MHIKSWWKEYKKAFLSIFSLKNKENKVQLFYEGHKNLKKKVPLFFTLLSRNSCFVKTGGRFFQILWPSHNVSTLRKLKAKVSTAALCRPIICRVHRSINNSILVSLINITVIILSRITVWRCGDIKDRKRMWRKLVGPGSSCRAARTV